MSQRFHYSVYGVHICAEFALWPWGTDPRHGSESGPRVDIGFARPGQAFPPPNFRPGLEDAVLEWPTVGTFWIRGGTEVRVAPASQASSEEIALVAGGPVLALVLEQRGHVVLHGSCVDVAGRATAFLGTSGAGKSTVAAALRDRGHRLISDGMTVVDCSGQEPLALPGPPHMKLWPDAISSLVGAVTDTRQVVRQEEKRWFHASSGVSEDAVPLRRVFLLESGAEVASERLAPAHAFMGLLRNYFLADYAESRSWEFIMRRCARIPSSVEVSRLRRGQSLTELSDVARAVLARGLEPSG